jgi:hypothetical protein
MGIPANWDLWVYLFRGELHTIAMGERGMRRAVRVGGLTLTLRDTCKELYLLCTMTSNNADWERRLFYLHNDGVGLPPYFGKVLMGKPDAWFHGVSPPSWNQRLESLTTALRHLADTGLGAASIIFNFHHRDERRCQPTSLARSRLLQECLLKEYVATRARRTINLKVVPHNDDYR